MALSLDQFFLNIYPFVLKVFYHLGLNKAEYRLNSLKHNIIKTRILNIFSDIVLNYTHNLWAGKNIRNKEYPVCVFWWQGRIICRRLSEFAITAY